MEKINKENSPSSWGKYFYCITNSFTNTPFIKQVGSWLQIWCRGFARFKNTNLHHDILYDFWGFYFLFCPQSTPLEENIPIYSQDPSCSHLNYWHCGWVCSSNWVCLWKLAPCHIRRSYTRKTYALLYLLAMECAEKWWNFRWP